MQHESLGQFGNANTGWDNMSAVPFRGAERAPGTSETPLEDSMHYWPPEMLADFGIVAPEEAQDYGVDTRSAEQANLRSNRHASEQNRERAVGYENLPDANSRAKVLNFLKWRSMQVQMDSNDPQFKASLREIIATDNPAELDEAAEEEVLYDIRDGVYGIHEERFLISRIAPPNKQNGDNAVLNSLNDLQERRFLANFTRAGFYGVNDLTGNHIREFMSRYPTPMDFIGMAQGLIQSITEKNGAQKGAEYQTAAETFMNKVYGKRYKYYKQFEELKAEASELDDPYEAMGEKLPKGVGFAGVAKGALRAIRDFVIRSNPRQTDMEFTQRLRNETLKYRHEQEQDSQDSVFIDTDRRIYGVYDGAGGVAGGREASRLASRVTGSLAEQYSLGDARQLANVLTMAGAKIVNAERNGRQIGITTGALTQIIDKGDGLRYVAYASAGDSRIYVVHPDGTAEQLTRDEGHENVIENYLGRGKTREYDDAGIMRRDNRSGREQNVTQYGERSLVRGDRIVICSDGITGDKGTDLMPPEEVGYYVAGAETAQAASENLLGYARKLDDRSVIVVDAYPPESSVVDGFLKRFLRNKTQTVKSNPLLRGGCVSFRELPQTTKHHYSDYGSNEE